MSLKVENAFANDSKSFRLQEIPNKVHGKESSQVAWFRRGGRKDTIFRRSSQVTFPHRSEVEDDF
jgi:hypothetical protein